MFMTIILLNLLIGMSFNRKIKEKKPFYVST